MSFETQQYTEDAAACAEASFFVAETEALRLPVFDTTANRSFSFLTDRSGQALTPTPHDAMTGLPLCYRPIVTLPKPSTPPQGNNRIADWEHLIPRAEVALATDNPALETDLGRMALMHARIQWVSFHEHHEVKNSIMKGPAQPHTRESLITLLMMAEAGYIPPDAMDFSHDSFRVRALRSGERDFLRDSGQVRMACEGFVRKFLLQTIMEDSVDHIVQETWLRFLAEMDYGRKVYLAHTLAAKMVERVIEPVAEPYKIAHRERLIPEYLPKKPAEFIKNTLIKATHHGEAVNVMAHRFGKEKRLQFPELYEPQVVA